MIERRWVLLAALAATVSSVPLLAAERLRAIVHKDPDCGCCAAYAELLRREGYDVKIVETRELAEVKRRLGVPVQLEGCHTTELGGYVFEGHVPFVTVRRVLAERPGIRGVALPGMPEGSPGMGGAKMEPFAIYELANGEARLWSLE